MLLQAVDMNLSHLNLSNNPTSSVLLLPSPPLFYRWRNWGRGCDFYDIANEWCRHNINLCSKNWCRIPECALWILEHNLEVNTAKHFFSSCTCIYDFIRENLSPPSRLDSLFSLISWIQCIVCTRKWGAKGGCKPQAVSPNINCCLCASFYCRSKLFGVYTVC